MFDRSTKPTALSLLKSAVLSCMIFSYVAPTSANGLQEMAQQLHASPNGYYDMLCNKFFPYAAFSGGYGKFDDAADHSGETGIARFALGSLWPITNTNSSIGAEIGIQSGNQQTLSQDVSSVFGVTDALPIIFVVKPPIDLLAVWKYQFTSPWFIQAKAGVAYLRTATESKAIPSDSAWNPELQVGAGFNISNNIRFVLSYQRIFGQSPHLTSVNTTAGTAKITHVPTWQAGMLSLEINL